MPDGDVPERVRSVARQIADARPMRRGSVSERRVKCNKPGCKCQTDEKARHGPYVSLVRVVGGKTRSRWIPADQAAELRSQVAAGQQFREQLETYWTACEEWADAKLKAHEAPAAAEAEKGGSRRVLRARSRKKSKR